MSDENSKRLANTAARDLYILEDESNPRGSQVTKVYPPTVLEQVFDQLSPTKKNLRQIIEDLRQEIITGGRGNIIFPVTTVNGDKGDVIITQEILGLGKVDNTRDADKPLSSPQRNAIMEILSRYDFKVNLDDIYSHLMDTTNPHDVTVDQINKNDELEEFVQRYISNHNNSKNSSIHMDIRTSLSGLWNLVDGINAGLEDRIGKVLRAIDVHVGDNLAHQKLFEKKEDIVNKAFSFSTTTDSDHTKYPSTRAVVEFVASRFVEFKKTLPNVVDWISDIVIVDTRDQLPTPTSRYFRNAYFIRTGVTSHAEVAICRLNSDGKSYAWDISQTGSYSKFDTECFIDTPEGLSIRMDKIIDAIISDNGMLDTSLSDILKAYYTRQQIDELNFVRSIKIVGGTSNGTIRYYINDDERTMSDDVRISGLHRLAYLDFVTEDELFDQAVHERHIMSNAIASRHIQKKVVAAENMTCKYGAVIGNTDDSTGVTAAEISLTQLADYLRPLIGGWPDPNVPGGNPWSEMLSEQLMHPHIWETGKEYPLGDYSYAQRFKGTISVLPNMNMRITLSEKLKLDEFKIIEAGGTWEYQSKPKEIAILGGSNITGHTFATVTMSAKGIFFDSISTGDRFEAEYDLWIKYVRPAEIAQLERPKSNS